MPLYDDLGNKFLTLPEQVNKNKKDIKALQESEAAVEPAGSLGDIQFNDDDALGASAELHWDKDNKRLGVGTNAPTKKLHVVGDAKISGDIDVGGDSYVTGNLDVENHLVVGGNLECVGNLLISGTTTTVNTETVEVEDNIIKVNSGQTGTPLSTLKSGIEVERGDEDNYHFVFDEADDSFKIGKTTLQPVATRESSPVDKMIPRWDSTDKQLKTDTTLYADNVNGRIGIGTAAPPTKLYIQGSGGTVASYVENELASDSATTRRIGIGVGGPDAPVANWVNSGYLESQAMGGLMLSSINNTMRFGAGGRVTQMILNTNGNVGIGTAAPAERLHVTGNGLFEGTNFFTDGLGTSEADNLASMHAASYEYSGILKLERTNPQFRNVYEVGLPGGHLVFAKEPVTTLANRILAIDGNDNRVAINGTYPGNTLEVNGNALIGSGYGAGHSDETGETAPTNGLLVEGNVGIGTTSPTEKLDVVGKVKASAGFVGNVTGTASGNLPDDAEINDLDDVTISLPSDGQFLQYHAASDTWKNVTVAPGGGSTTTSTLLASSASISSSFTLTVSGGLNDYDDIRVIMVTRQGNNDETTPWRFQRTECTVRAAEFYYYNDSDNGYARSGAGFHAPRYYGQTLAFNVFVAPANEGRTSLQVKLAGIISYAIQIKIYGITY
jgi:hypothetical protein